MKENADGHEAIGLGALHAGVGLFSDIPERRLPKSWRQWRKTKAKGFTLSGRVNEKAAIEAAAGAAYAGARSMVTMKQVGLNVASDPLMSLTMWGQGWHGSGSGR